MLANRIAWGRVLALCVLGLVAARARLFFRPDLVSLVFVVLLARSLLGARRDAPIPFWRLVGLQVVWVNVHGYFTLGPLVTFAVTDNEGLNAAHPLNARASASPATSAPIDKATDAAM